ncbi:thiamine phosphate synthase [bacterium]|nr:thiamine phosphate synthase [bacterium]
MKIDFHLYAITDRKRITKDRFLYLIEKAFDAGLKAIQIREKDLSPLELFRLSEQIKIMAGRYHAKTFINDRVDILLALDLDGVHMTEQSLPVDQIRKIIGKEKLIGVSTHSLEKLQTALAASADFAVLGPVAVTPSKTQGHMIMSSEQFKSACSKVKIPVFALGGVNTDNVRFWIKQGAHGVAGISIWMEAEDIAVRLKQLEKSLEHL